MNALNTKGTLENTIQPAPRELITQSIESTLSEALNKIGFTFSRKQLTFSRKTSHFIHTISFQLNRHNETAVSAEFWTVFSITSKEYAKWHKTTFGNQPLNDHLFIAMDWNIPNWKFPMTGNHQHSHFELIEEAHRENVLAILKSNILELGIPFLDHFSNWETAARNLLTKNTEHHKASDFFQLAGHQEESLSALKQGLIYWKQHPNASSPDDLEEIHKRLKAPSI